MNPPDWAPAHFSSSGLDARPGGRIWTFFNPETSIGLSAVRSPHPDPENSHLNLPRVHHVIIGRVMDTGEWEELEEYQDLGDDEVAELERRIAEGEIE